MDDKRTKIAVYGLSAQTQAFLERKSTKYNIIALLDGYKKDGEMYGYRIMSLEEAIKIGIQAIVVVARPSSRRIIINRIEKKCIEHSIEVYDLDGRDLLSYSHEEIEKYIESGISKEELLKQIDDYDVISFDIFDTLLTRNTLYPADIFKLVESKLIEEYGQGYNYAQNREQAELELSRECLPTINDIYNRIRQMLGISQDVICRMQQIEWEIESNILISRYDMCQVLKYAVQREKKVYLVSDMYYSSEQLEQLLSSKSIKGYKKIIISCEYGVTKSQGLFEVLKREAKGKSYLHIGDNYLADVESAKKYGVHGIWIRSGLDMFDMMSWSKDFIDCDNITARIKQGMFISRIFNSPFALEQKKVIVRNPEDIGYLFIAPILTDFVIWLFDKLSEEGNTNIFFAARDGYLIKKLYEQILNRKINCTQKLVYLLISRISANFNSLFTESDVFRAFDIDFSGSFSQMMKTRFLFEDSELNEETKDIEKYIDKILCKSKNYRSRYLDYISNMDLYNEKDVFYDFVSSGTCQLALEKIYKKKLQGYYFIHVDDNDVEKKQLDIHSFYSQEEAEKAGIYEEYFIIENLLTAPTPSFCYFDEQLQPVYLKESRSEEEIEFIKSVHRGILQYFEQYINVLNIKIKSENKKCSENILGMMRKVVIENECFNNMIWKDDFFNRNVKVCDMM